MASLESILIPTDGSDGAMAGARRGVNLAAAAGADVVTLSVIDDRETEPSLALDPDGRTEREELLEEQASHAVDRVRTLAQRHLSGTVETAVEWGIPFDTIIDYAEQHDIDLIVMGTHGRSGLQRVLLGSVAEKVLRASSVPVLMVPPAADTADVGVGRYENVLVPTDGSEGAEVAVEWGITLASIYDAMVHTVYSIDVSRFGGNVDRIDIYGALEQVGREAIESIREATRSAELSGTGTLGSGPATRVILAYADEHDVDLIVMGTHGRSGVERYLIGSVTEGVVRNASVPVCCVPMREFP
jgi:nucleotide-binding universal stress UspA family protein